METNLPKCNLQFVSAIELLLSENQIQTFSELFAAGAKPDNAVYIVWETLKRANLPAAMDETVTSILSTHTPKNIPKNKKKGEQRCLREQPDIFPLLRNTGKFSK